jgi:hypothetical protein
MTMGGSMQVDSFFDPVKQRHIVLSMDGWRDGWMKNLREKRPRKRSGRPLLYVMTFQNFTTVQFRHGHWSWKTGPM